MYLALYRKWRPQIFDDVISQPHITIPLKNQVKNNRTAHAYLFTGSRGTGKTTCSKILAKAVNCLNPQDGNPCLECDICRGIENESLLDVVEIDAASNNGVDYIRELREESSYTPAVCKYRVYIIDETHMLSNGAFNALLKIMEEPPPHVKFILATTEVHKVPATILSRCQRFDFKRIKNKDIAQLLLTVAQKENISLYPDAADLIAKISDGGMRDAFSLLDQCLAFSDKIDIEIVSQTTGIASKDYLFKLSEFIIKKDAANALNIIDELYSQMSDLQRLCDELIVHFRNLMIVKTVKNPNDLLICNPQEIEDLVLLSKQISLDDILNTISVLSNSFDRMGKISSKRLEFEMCIIRLCSIKNNNLNDVSIVNRIEQLEKIINSGVLPSQDTKSNPIQSNTPIYDDKSKILSKTQNKPVEINFNNLKPVPFWIDILKKLNETDPPLSGILFGSKAYEYEDIMFIDSPNSMFSQLLKQQGCASRLSEAITKQTGKKYKLRLRSGNENLSNKNTNNPDKDPLDALAEIANKSGAQVNIND